MVLDAGDIEGEQQKFADTVWMLPSCYSEWAESVTDSYQYIT